MRGVVSFLDGCSVKKKPIHLVLVDPNESGHSSSHTYTLVLNRVDYSQ